MHRLSADRHTKSLSQLVVHTHWKATTSLGCFKFPQTRKPLQNWLQIHSSTAVWESLHEHCTNDQFSLTVSYHFALNCYSNSSFFCLFVGSYFLLTFKFTAQALVHITVTIRLQLYHTITTVLFTASYNRPSPALMIFHSVTLDAFLL